MPRLYFEKSSSNAIGVPADSLSTALTANVSALTVHDLVTAKPSVAGDTIALLAMPPSAALRRGYFGKWVTAPLTGITTLTAQSYHFALVGNESVSTEQQYFTAVAYVVKQDGTRRGGYVFDSDVEHGTEIPTVAAGREFAIAGSQISGVTPTDRFCVEVWSRGTPSVSDACNLRFRYAGSTLPVDLVANADACSYLDVEQGGWFDVPPPPPQDSTTLWLRDTADNRGPVDAFEKSAAMTPLQRLNQVSDLSQVEHPPTLDLPPASRQLRASATEGTYNDYVGKFVSEPLGVATIPAGSWEIGFVGTEGGPETNNYLALSVYVVEADGLTVRSYIYDSQAHIGAEFSNVANSVGQVQAFTGVEASGISVGSDRLVVEIWYTTPGQVFVPLTIPQRTFLFDGSTPIIAGAMNTNPKTYIIVPVQGLISTVTTLAETAIAQPTGVATLKGAEPKNLAGSTQPTKHLTLDLHPTLNTGIGGEATPFGQATFQKIGQPAPSGTGGGSGKRQPWLEFCGVEVMNAARTASYIAKLQPRIEQLADLHPVLNWTTGVEQVYEHPATDPAPWYDAGVSESAEFLGFIGTISEISTPTTRQVTSLARGGAQLGGSRVSARTVTIRGFLVATTWAGQSYGQQWITSTLSGCEGCGLCDTRVYLHAPTLDRLASNDGRYTLYDSALTDGPKELASPVCPELLQLEWTITSERGEWFSEPALLAAVQEIPEETSSGGCVEFSQWLCTQPLGAVDGYLLTPRIGVEGVIVSIDCTDAPASGIEIGLYSDCSALGTPLRRLRVDAIPEGAILTIDSSRRRCVYVSPEGEVRDGIGYLVPDDDLDVEWMELDACDGPMCVVVRKLGYCSETTSVLVGIMSQLRVR